MGNPSDIDGKGLTGRMRLDDLHVGEMRARGNPRKFKLCVVGAPVAQSLVYAWGDIYLPI